jgi:hypothetical protein
VTVLTIGADDFDSGGLTPARAWFDFSLFSIEVGSGRVVSTLTWRVFLDGDGDAQTELPAAVAGSAVEIASNLAGWSTVLVGGYPGGTITLTDLITDFGVARGTLVPLVPSPPSVQEVLGQAADAAAAASSSAAGAADSETAAASSAADAAATAATVAGSLATALEPVQDQITALEDAPGIDEIVYPMLGLGSKVGLLNSATDQVKWASFGDSYAMTIYTEIDDVLIRSVGGQAGAIFSFSGGVTSNATTGTVTDVTNEYRWVTGVASVLASAGASRTYGMGGSTATCTQIKVFHLNSGGTFKIQVDGVDHTTPAVGSDNSLGVTTISVAVGAHTVKVVQLTGSPIVLGAGFIDTTKNGLVPIALGAGGLALTSVTVQAWTNLGTFLADVLPDVLTFEMKEIVAGYAANLETFYETTSAAAPAMDVIAIGSTPIATDDASQVQMNELLRQATNEAGQIYWDSYSLFGSYAALVELGWQGDGVHVHAYANAYRGMRMLQDLGILNLPGRYDPLNVNADMVHVRTNLKMGREATTLPVFQVIPDLTFDQDVTVRTRRFLNFADEAGTLVARLTMTAGQTSIVPLRVQVGENMAGFFGVSATHVSARRSTMSQLADFSARALLPQMPATITVSAVAGAVVLDLSTGSAFAISMDANVTSLTFSNSPGSGAIVFIHFIQTAAGSKTLAGVAGGLRFAGGTPTLTATANKTDSFVFQAVPGGVLSEISRAMNK